MPKKLVQIFITGKPRPEIDVDAVTQIVIAHGRELAERIDGKSKANAAHDKVANP